MDTEQQLKLEVILEKFEQLSGQKFSFKRECAIDDVLAALMRIKFDSGHKNYKEQENTRIRARCFTYKCDDKKHNLVVRVVIVKGKVGKSRFTVTKNF